MANPYCKVNGCLKRSTHISYYCTEHEAKDAAKYDSRLNNDIVTMTLGPEDFELKPVPPKTMAEKYPKYYKPVGNLTEVDTYAIGKLFPVDDPTGCIMHARKKLLVPGTRTGGKTFRQDIVEARDTLNRWLELNPE